MERNDTHFKSRLLTCAGSLMIISGILMAVCVKLAYGGILWVAASCMFFAAYNFRKQENKMSEAEESKDEYRD